MLTVPGDPCPGDFFTSGPAPDVFSQEGSTDEWVFNAYVTPPPAPPAPSTTPAGKRKKYKEKKKR